MYYLPFARVYGTWDLKSLHLWSMESGAKKNVVKMIDVTKTHCTITAVDFSHHYRVSTSIIDRQPAGRC